MSNLWKTALATLIATTLIATPICLAAQSGSPSPQAELAAHPAYYALSTAATQVQTNPTVQQKLSASVAKKQKQAVAKAKEAVVIANNYNYLIKATKKAKVYGRKGSTKTMLRVAAVMCEKYGMDVKWYHRISLHEQGYKPYRNNMWGWGYKSFNSLYEGIAYFTKHFVKGYGKSINSHKEARRYVGYSGNWMEKYL
jgi:hypothetical protein